MGNLCTGLNDSSEQSRTVSVKLKLNITDTINKTQTSQMIDTESSLLLERVRKKYQAENPGASIKDCNKIKVQLSIDYVHI